MRLNFTTFLTPFLILVTILVSICKKEVNSSPSSFGHYLVKNSGLRKRSFLENINENESIKVGIIGAGISGLYAATLLQDLGLDYEILEASNRIGGRIHTHYFGKESGNDYVELGAMHFPPMKEYDRLIGKQNWSLISYLNRHLKSTEQIQLIEFITKHDNNVFYFNNIRKLRCEVQNSTKDLFGFGKSNGGYIDDSFADRTADFWVNKATGFIGKFFDGNFSRGFQYLLKNDWKTFRSWLMDPNNRNFGYPSDVVDWMETLGPDTGFFSNSILSTYFDGFYFSKTNITIDGGYSKVIREMVALLSKKPKLNHKVTRLRQSKNKNLIVTANEDNFNYTHVIVTPQFTVLRDIHFDLEMQIKKRVAMRVLNYQFAVKVALLFKTRFWENATLMNGHSIFGGQTISDLLIRQTIYPSQAINCSNCRGALLVSYTWGNDAKKLLAFSEFEIIKKCLSDLSIIHGSVVYEQFTGKYAMMDWTRNPFTQGAYGLYNPGQTASFYPALIYPEASGRLHFAGETLSIFNGWSIGAIISGYRSVKDILSTQGMVDKVKELEERWGTIDEPDFTDFE